MKTKEVFILSFLLIFFVSFNVVSAEEKVCVYFFWGKGCPHCAQEKTFLESLQEKYPQLELHGFEIYYNRTSAELFNKIADLFNAKPVGVPMTFIDGKAFIGFDWGNVEFFHPRYKAFIGYSDVIEKAIVECIQHGGCDCPSPEIETQKIESNVIEEENVSVPISPLKKTITLPLFGRISTETSLLILGFALGLVDGTFNPCALSVIFFLCAYLMGIGSRKKSLMVGSVYGLTVFFVYLVFMYGLLNVIMLTGYLDIIKMIAAILILIAGIIEIKDFFFYGKWVSLEIPKFAKPTIEKLIKMATLPSAFLLGIFVSFVEIPCAGVFPFIYITILGERVTSAAASLIYLIWYCLFFISPLIILTFIFYFGWMKVEEAEEKRLKTRKYMRLAAGLIMISLAIWLLVS